MNWPSWQLAMGPNWWWNSPTIGRGNYLDYWWKGAVLWPRIHGWWWIGIIRKTEDAGMCADGHVNRLHLSLSLVNTLVTGREIEYTCLCICVSTMG